MLGFCILGARKLFPFLVISISFLLLVIVEFLIISRTLTGRTCYNWHYNSNSLAMQHLVFILFSAAQIIGSEIIQTDDKVFPK